MSQPVIQQRELQEHMRNRANLTRLRARARRLEEEVKAENARLVSRINDGARIREGVLTAEIEEKTRATRISEARVKAILGEELLQEVKENLGETPFDDLQIFEAINTQD